MYRSVPFNGKRLRRPQTGIKDGFEEMEHEFPFGIFRPEKQDYLFRCSVAPGNFPLGRPKKLCSIYFRTGFPGKFLSKGQIPGRARLKERLSRSKLKQAFLIDSDAELFIRLMKSSASEPGLRIHLVMATTSLIYGSVVSP